MAGKYSDDVALGRTIGLSENYPQGNKMRERFRRRGPTVYFDLPSRAPKRVLFHIDEGLTEEQVSAVDTVISLANMALNLRAVADQKIKSSYPHR